MRKEIRPEKLRDMTRSILPSKNRVAARKAKATLTRSVRRTVRATVRFDDPETTWRDFLMDANQSGNVAWRRGADKLNHFMRWCERITRGMRKEDALSYVRAILPRNLIGDHAYSHWEAHVKFRRRRLPRDRAARYWQGITDRMRYWLRRALEKDPELFAVINAAIKARKEPDEPRRLLRGFHDVDAFVAEAVNEARYRIEWDVLLEVVEWP